MFENNIAMKNKLKYRYRAHIFSFTLGGKKMQRGARAFVASCARVFPISHLLTPAAWNPSRWGHLRRGNWQRSKSGLFSSLGSWMLDIYEHTMGRNPVCKGKSGHCYQVKGEWILGRQKQPLSTRKIYLKTWESWSWAFGITIAPDLMEHLLCAGHCAKYSCTMFYFTPSFTFLLFYFVYLLF